MNASIAKGSNINYQRRPELSSNPVALSREETTSEAVNCKMARKKTNRVLSVNPTSRDHNTFRSNKISTTKYNLFTFIPKFLFEQFRRYANCFFLAIVLLQQIPDVSPTGRYTTLLPLTIILLLSALKEIVEDWKRHRADNTVNNTAISVFDERKGQFKTVKWKDIRVGEIVKVSNGEFFPADLILLSSSEPKGMCYVETSNLDGETNLKIKTAIPQTYKELENKEHVADAVIKGMKGKIECEEPNRNLYEFVGNMQIRNNVAPLSQSSILLRGTKLMNTQFIYGTIIYSGHDTKIIMNSREAPLKRSSMDKFTNHQILFLFILLVILALVSALASLMLKNEITTHSYLPYNETNFFS
jgi:phospholipid-transporting ATPase